MLCATTGGAAEPGAVQPDGSNGLEPAPGRTLTASPAVRGVDESEPPRKETLPAHENAPVLLYTYQAFGSPAPSLGGQSFVGGATSSERPVRGEFTVYGSPIDHLTLLATAGSRAEGEWAPSVTIVGRILGSRAEGWGLGIGATYKTEGFASVEGEVEGALLFSLKHRRFHGDVNAVLGGGLEEEEEHDAEGKLRLGYDLAEWCRIGIDGRVRHRLGGPKALVGGRTSDVATGAEFVASFGRVYAVALAGVSTVDVASGVSPLGWIGVGALAL